ncbi:hypothetical protein K8R62_00660 [bacterium]|nr:hypothetical protein [bacterium]
MKKIYILFLFIFFIILLSGCDNQKIEDNTINNSSSGQQSNIKPKTKAYYENFRQKCGEDQCCLSSIDHAELQNSLLFESNKGNMNIDADCPAGYGLNMNRCLTSYIWCEKN